MTDEKAISPQARGIAPVDIVPWPVGSHHAAVSRVVRQCDSLTVLAYRDRAARILDDVRGIQEVCEAHARRYRIGVETQPPSSSIPSSTTFGDDGAAVLRRELTAVAAGIRHPLFDGFAVHHLGSWQTMPPDRLIDPGRVASVPIKMLSPRPSST